MRMRLEYGAPLEQGVVWRVDRVDVGLHEVLQALRLPALLHAHHDHRQPRGRWEERRMVKREKKNFCG